MKLFQSIEHHNQMFIKLSSVGDEPELSTVESDPLATKLTCDSQRVWVQWSWMNEKIKDTTVINS